MTYTPRMIIWFCFFSPLQCLHSKQKAAVEVSHFTQAGSPKKELICILTGHFIRYTLLVLGWSQSELP